MKKIAVLFIALIIAVIPLSLCAAAAELSDGIYEVPVTLRHKEDDKESFGNKYVAQTALLKVEDGKKTVTILLTTDMKGIEFSYYINGSIEGDVEPGTPVSDITVAGETYKQGFEIPVMAEGEIGLQFSVPVMPMSPSAKLRIDYDNAVLVSASEEPETEPVTQTTTAPTTAESTTKKAETETTAGMTVTTTAPATQPTTVTTTTAATTAIAADSAEASDEKESGGIPSAVLVILFVCATIALVLLSTSDSKEESENDDK